MTPVNLFIEIPSQVVVDIKADIARLYQRCQRLIDQLRNSQAAASKLREEMIGHLNELRLSIQNGINCSQEEGHITAAEHAHCNAYLNTTWDSIQRLVDNHFDSAPIVAIASIIPR